PEVGTVQGVTTKLLLKESASPAFKRARPAHYVLPSAVEEELTRLEHQGVLKPEEVSDWATPTVHVPKSDGPVRIYGDYKGTINPTIQTEEFLLPTMEEMRAVGVRSEISRTTRTPRVYSGTVDCHLEFLPVLLIGNVSLNECKQEFEEPGSVPSSQNAEMDALSRLLSPSTLDHEAAYDFDERLISSLSITYKEITPRHTC
ncbi:Uncharacterized protein P5673_009357, partial [Acropora cervicornis]